MVGTVIEVGRVGERRLAAHESDFSSLGGVVGGARWSECRLLGVGCVHIRAGSFVLLCTTSHVHVRIRINVVVVHKCSASNKYN